MARTSTKNQERAIRTDGADICVAAGAGSGKTGVLVERFVRLVTESRNGSLPPEQRAAVDQILVITFTEKATKEMKTRIVGELMRLGLTDERRQVETAYISTIHGFCSRVLQENPFEVGIDPHFTVLEEAQARRLLRQTVESVVAQAFETEGSEIESLIASIQALRRFGEEQVDPVSSAAAAVESLLARLRSAGRTQTEVQRHWESGMEASTVVAEQLSWTVMAPLIEEARACISTLAPLQSALLGTARATCGTLLRAASAIVRGGSLSEMTDCIKEIYQIVRKTRAHAVGINGPETALLQQMGLLKAACDARLPLFEKDMPDPESSAACCHRMWGLTAAVWSAYDAAKRRLGVLDNDDLQSECVRLLQDYPDVRHRYQRRLRYIMVDEFQDTNPLQMRLIELLHVKRPEHSQRTADGAESSSAPRNFLFVVGDVQQSIYAFRGAEPSLFRELERSYRVDGAGTHVSLATNFRSRPEILGVIAHLFSRVWSSGDAPFTPLEAGAPFDEASAPSLELLLSQDLVRRDYLGLEPAALAQRVRQIVEGEEVRLTSHLDPRCGEPIRYRDIAVLLRQLTDIQKYEEAFARAGVPYFVVGGGRGYYARQEIRDVLNILTVLETPLDDVALLGALRSPIVGLEIDTIYKIVEAASESETDVGLIGPAATHAGSVSEARTDATTGDAPAGASGQRPKLRRGPLYSGMERLLAAGTLPAEETERLGLFVEVMGSLRAQEDRLPVGRLLERLIARTSYDARLLCRPHGRRRLANIRKLLQMANSDPVIGVREFIRRLRDLEKLSDREGDAPTEEEAADVVRFHTIHGAKGLEFPVIVLADLGRQLEHPESGLFACEPHLLAMGSRVCGAPDAAYRAIDFKRRESDRAEAERLLYVAMTRARERLILCGNLGRSRGTNWADLLFQSLGINEAPPEPVTRALIGGISARIAPLSHYTRAPEQPLQRATPRHLEVDMPAFANRLANAVLARQEIESVPIS